MSTPEQTRKVGAWQQKKQPGQKCEKVCLMKKPGQRCTVGVQGTEGLCRDVTLQLVVEELAHQAEKTSLSCERKILHRVSM